MAHYKSFVENDKKFFVQCTSFMHDIAFMKVFRLQRAHVDKI